jgi:hypothetical protein
MTKPIDTPEAVGFREAEEGVDMVLNIGTDHEIRMIIPGKAAIEWGRQLMLIGAQALERNAKRMQEEMVTAAISRSVWIERDFSCMARDRLDS